MRRKEGYMILLGPQSSHHQGKSDCSDRFSIGLLTMRVFYAPNELEGQQINSNLREV